MTGRTGVMRRWSALLTGAARGLLMLSVPAVLAAQDVAPPSPVDAPAAVAPMQPEPGPVVETAEPAPTIDAGDTAWILMSSALVLLMTPALAFFYGGLVRSKNVLNTMMLGSIALGFVSVLWPMSGYSLAFGSGSSFIGDTSAFFMRGVTAEPGVLATIPGTLFLAFQGTFAIIT